MYNQETIKNKIREADKIAVGLGEEWYHNNAYDNLYQLLGGKDYFIITMATDDKIYKSNLDSERVVAPCGSKNRYQCATGCNNNLWSKDEVMDQKVMVCPHCGAALVENTVQNSSYIEDGYLSQWKEYQNWLQNTLNQRLLLLELGVGFKFPTVIRWPFEKMAFINQKAYMYRINQEFWQISAEINQKAVGIQENSVSFIEKISRS